MEVTEAVSMDSSTFVNTVILTATVFAALLSSIVNIIISLINNRKLKKIEKQKQMNEIDKYRYSRLYELVLNWYDYDTETAGDTASEIAFYKLLNLFMDDSRRYEFAKPLLDKCFVELLELKKTECNELLDALIEAEAPDGTHTKEFPHIRKYYFTAGQEFSKLLKDTINTQLEVLLGKNN